MPYYQAPDETIHFLDDQEFEHVLPHGSEMISDDKAAELLTPKKKYPIFTGNQKLDLFSKEEQLSIVAATMVDAHVKLMYDRLLGAAYLSYEDPETEIGLSLLVNNGLLTVERKNEIVDKMQPK